MDDKTIITRPFNECADPPGFGFMVMAKAAELELTGYYRPRSIKLVRKFYVRKLIGSGPLPGFSGPFDLMDVPPTSEIFPARDVLDLSKLGLAVGDLIQVDIQHFISDEPVEQVEDVLLRLDVVFRMGDA